jgi:phosphate starvation-inducible PhoH-like protein
LNPVQISFTPVDNERLSNLCGVLDENLKQIEAALDVSIARRGENFSVSGEAKQTRLAAEALRRFYEMAVQNLSVEDVQLGLIEVANPNRAPASADGEPILLTRRRDLHGRTPHQVQYLRQIQEYDITFGIGPAGTGKTYLAMAMAVSALLHKEVHRIILARPAVEAGEKLGYLPGTLFEKINPYLRPLYDALYDMLETERATRLIEQGTIEIAPLAFMRGRTLNDSFIILDEAQNTTSEQMKMFLTRLGFGSKTVITGDITQVDLPAGRVSGLIEVRAILKDIPGIRFIHFTEEDVVRHELVQQIVRAYEAYQGAPADPGA